MVDLMSTTAGTIKGKPCVCLTQVKTWRSCRYLFQTDFVLVHIAVLGKQQQQQQNLWNNIHDSLQNEVKNEISVMNQLNHVNLIQLYDAFESKNDIVLVME